MRGTDGRHDVQHSQQFEANIPPSLPVNPARVDGQWKPVSRQLGPLTRAVNSGSGNRA